MVAVRLKCILFVLSLLAPRIYGMGDVEQIFDPQRGTVRSAQPLLHHSDGVRIGLPEDMTPQSPWTHPRLGNLRLLEEVFARADSSFRARLLRSLPMLLGGSVWLTFSYFAGGSGWGTNREFFPFLPGSATD